MTWLAKTTYSLQTESWETWTLAKGNLFTRQCSWLSRCSAQLGEEGRNWTLPFPFQMQVGRRKYERQRCSGFLLTLFPSKAGLYFSSLASVLFIVRMRPTSRLYFPLLSFLSWELGFMTLTIFSGCCPSEDACCWRASGRQPRRLWIWEVVFSLSQHASSQESLLQGVSVHRGCLSSCQYCESPIPEVPTWCLRSVLP